MSVNELRSLLCSPDEALIISSEVNRAYFTSFDSSDGYLIVTRDDAVFFTDSRYIEAAGLKAENCRARLLKSFKDDIGAFLKENGIKKLYTECERLTVAELAAFNKSTGEFCTAEPSEKLEELIDALRSVKSQGEVENIIAAQRIAEQAFDHILGFIKPGVTEREIGLELDYYMLKAGAEALSFETIAVTGAKSSMPHGVPDGNTVKYGDFITMDYGAVVNGYHSDMTRTVAVGSVNDEQKRVYDTVLEAQLASLAALKAGVACSAADAAARDIIAAAGYGEYFGHGTGHGVGVEIHEKPNVSPRSTAVLKSGNVVTVEPGIYLPGRFGVRIEDMALITDDGCRDLTGSPKELIVL